MNCFIDTEPTPPFVQDGISLWTSTNHTLADFAYIVSNDEDTILFSASCPGFHDLGGGKQNEVLDLFEYHTQGVDKLVAYRHETDLKWILAGYRAANRNTPTILGQDWIEFSDILNTAFGYWPKLTDAYAQLFGYELKDAHTALADVRAMYDIYVKLKQLATVPALA